MVLEPLGTDVAFAVIAEGNISNYDSDLHVIKRTEIYQSQQQLDSAMQRYLNEMPVLTVDFTSNQAVLITQGIQGGIGDRFRIDSAVDYEDYVSLDVTYEGSGPGCIKLGAINHPYKLLEISSSKIVVINERFEWQDCSAQ